jgi:rod shape-determining protein MreD
VRFFLGLFILVVAGSLQVAGSLYLAKLHLSIDLPLVCVVCGALLLKEQGAIAVALCAGAFKDAFSTGCFGHSIAVFTVISLLVNRVRHLLWISHWTSQSGLAFAGTVVAWVLYDLISKILGQPLDYEVGAVLKSAVLNACAAPPLFRVWSAAMK